MIRVFLITVNKIYRQRVFVTVACHSHGSAVYALSLIHISFKQALTELIEEGGVEARYQRSVSYTHLDVYKRQPRRRLPRCENPERLCRKHEIPLLERRSQTARWLRNDRQHLPCYMGLAPVLVYDSPVSYTHLTWHGTKIQWTTKRSPKTCTNSPTGNSK